MKIYAFRLYTPVIPVDKLLAFLKILLISWDEDMLSEDVETVQYKHSCGCPGSPPILFRGGSRLWLGGPTEGFGETRISWGLGSESVGAPVLMLLFCHPDTHYLCIRVGPISISLDCDPHKSTTIQPPYTCCKRKSVLTRPRQYPPTLVSGACIGSYPR
jgi:hypothetical protein